MSETICYEGKVFLLFVWYGMILLLGYDVLRSFRRAVRHGSIWVAAEDCVFCLLAGLATFVMIFVYQDGTLRLYTAAAMGAGMFFYIKSFSRWVITALTAVFCLFFRIPVRILKKTDDIWQKIVAIFVRKD